MTTTTLRRWGGAIAVSLPKKVLALLDLHPGSQVEVAVEDGKIVLSPRRPRFSLEQLLSEQNELEATLGHRLVDEVWLNEAPRGRELL